MNPFIWFILSLIVISINPGKVDAFEQGRSYSLKGSVSSVSEPASLNIPSWAVQIPENSYVGISSPCTSIEAARQQALESAIGQILQSMGADYHLRHESNLSGDLHQSRYELNERLSYTARWLLNSVQNNIKRYAFENTGNGHICFVLVHMRPSDLERLKRLTIGARVSARLIGTSSGQASIEVNETNGVGVTITEYHLNAVIRNNHAKLITLFLWKVPETDNINYEGALRNRLSLKNSSGRIAISLINDGNRAKSIIMGSKETTSITLTGYDELGRHVAVSVRIP